MYGPAQSQKLKNPKSENREIHLLTYEKMKLYLKHLRYETQRHRTKQRIIQKLYRKNRHKHQPHIHKPRFQSTIRRLTKKVSQSRTIFPHR